MGIVFGFRAFRGFMVLPVVFCLWESRDYDLKFGLQALFQLGFGAGFGLKLSSQNPKLTLNPEPKLNLKP